MRSLPKALRTPARALGAGLVVAGAALPAPCALPVPAELPADGAHPTDGPDVDVRIWLDDRSLRFRVDANLAFLDEVAEVPRELEDALAEVEEQGAALTLFDTVAEANRVVVDGLEIDPVLDSWNVLPADPALVNLFPIGGARSLIRIRLDYRYPLLSSPSQVSMVWGLFPVDAVMRAGPDGPRIVVNAQLNAGGYDEPLQFTVDEPEVIWHGELPDEDELFLPVPAAAAPEPPTLPGVPLALLPVVLVLGVSLLRSGRRGAALGSALALGLVALVGRDWWRIPLEPRADLPTEAEALAIFEPLHQNIYRAFGFPDEERVYDALARSVDGELLDALYRQVYRGLVMEEEGGAVSRVQAVRRIAADVEQIGMLGDGRPGFTLSTRWQVDGAVFHWSHAHRRTQEYLARYSVARVEGRDSEPVWRIVGNEVLEQEVVATAAGEEQAVSDDDLGAPGVLMSGAREL